MADGAVAVLPAATLQYKSGAVFHQFRQESNFFWLTGWNEDGAIAVIEKTGTQRGDYAFHMFVKPKDRRQEQWSGFRNGIDAAMDVFNADTARKFDDAAAVLPRIIDSAKLVYADTLPDILAGVGGSRLAAKKTRLSSIVEQLRAIKSPAEVANMRRAGQLSGRALTEAMRRPWTREKDLHAFLHYQFVANGCDDSAFIPVVAGGDRANCIHYTVNNDVLRDGEFVLVDSGGEYGTYITDISRTWPVSGKFTPPQRDLYEAVLRAQRTSVSLCRASARMSLDDIHQATERSIAEELRSIGFDVCPATVDQLFPHHVGHYIGLDVHDCPSYIRHELLQTGHCVTIEPGVYVPDDERWPSHFRGMGVRIEDSVCVDDESPYFLSTEAVKEIVDIEALRS